MHNKAKANASHPFPQEVIENSKVGGVVVLIIHYFPFNPLFSSYSLTIVFADEAPHVDVSEALYVNQSTHTTHMCMPLYSQVHKYDTKQ